MMEHTDVQLAEAEKQVEAALQNLEHLGIPREAAIHGGKKFRDALRENRRMHISSISITARFRRS